MGIKKLKIWFFTFLSEEPYKSVLQFLLSENLTSFPVENLKEIPPYLKSLAFNSQKNPAATNLFINLYSKKLKSKYPLAEMVEASSKKIPSPALEISSSSVDYIKVLTALTKTSKEEKV